MTRKRSPYKTYTKEFKAARNWVQTTVLRGRPYENVHYYSKLSLNAAGCEGQSYILHERS